MRQSKKMIKEYVPLIILVFLCILFSGCLDRTEEITVHDDGSVTMTCDYSGSLSDFDFPVAIPDGPGWTILEKNIDSSTTNQPRLKLEVEREYKNGEELLSTYADPSEGNFEASLKFPTEVRRWEENGRVFYEFKRVYKARRYFRYNYLADDKINEELENKVAEEGIFSLTKEERNNYVGQLVEGIAAFHFLLASDATGALVKQSLIRVELRRQIEQAFIKRLESIIVPERLLTILSHDEDSVGYEFEKLEKQISQELVGIVSQLEGSNSQIATKFDIALQRRRMVWKVTEKTGNHKFTVFLQLPGDIIEANGITDPFENGEVVWEFEGTDLHDHDIPLYALSVVEK